MVRGALDDSRADISAKWPCTRSCHLRGWQVAGDGVGGQRYTTRVWRKADDTLQSDCSCPVILNGCKHAVAVVVAYLDMLAKDVHVPVTDLENSRQVESQRETAEVPHEDPEGGGDSEEYDELSIPRQGGKRSKSEVDDERIRKHIEAKSRDELVELLWSLTLRLPEVQEEFREHIALSEGDVGRLLANARKELRKVTSEPGWMDYWGGEGYTPDFGRLIRYLDRMIECGQANAVVKLGLEILDRGTELLQQSNDKGETTMAFAKCLPSVFRALTISTLSSVRKLLFAIDAHLIDEFEVMMWRCLVPSSRAISAAPTGPP